MDTGFALNWVVSNDGSMTLFGARDLQLLRAPGATTARFEFRLGAVREWTDALRNRFAAVARQIAAAGITPIGLLGADIIDSVQQAQWNAG